MKQILQYALVVTALVTSFGCNSSSDKSQRPSPPARVSETTTSGNTITIDYSQPSVKGRTIGKDIAPFGKVWRTGANEATWIEISKDAQVQGKPLPAGKYAIYTIPDESEWTIIFNKMWDQWGTNYAQAEDVLRVQVQPTTVSTATEQMTFTIAKDGTVSLRWGNTQVNFTVQ